MGSLYHWDANAMVQMNNVGPVVLGHPQEKTPYQKGFETGRDYWRNQKNPFDEKDWRATRWQEGFNDGIKERKEPDPDPYAGYYGIWG